MPTVTDEDRPRHEVGDVIMLDNPDKAEHGSIGTVERVCAYTGPTWLDRWDYRVEWQSGFLSGMRSYCPERWARAVEDG